MYQLHQLGKCLVIQTHFTLTNHMLAHYLLNCTEKTVVTCVMKLLVHSSGVSQLKTRLNFSEADSMMSMHQQSGLVGPSHESMSVSTNGRTAGSTSIAMFNTTLDCEKRVRVVVI